MIQGVSRFYPLAAKVNSLSSLRHTLMRFLWVASVLIMIAVIAAGTLDSSRIYGFWAWVGTGILTISSILLVIERNFFAAARRQQWAVAVEVFRFWLQPLFAIILVAWIGPSPFSIVGGMALGAIAVCFLFRVSSVSLEGSKEVDSQDQGPSYGMDILRYSMPLVVVIPFLWINNLGDRYIAGHLLGFEAVGIYAACYGLVGQPFISSGDAVMQFMRPLYYNAVSSGDIHQEIRILVGWLGLSGLIFVSGILLVYFLRETIAALCLAPEYRDATLLMPWIAAGVALQQMARVFEAIFHAFRRTHFYLITQSIGAAVCILVVWVWTEKEGILGTAKACPLYFGLIFLITLALGLGLMKREGRGPQEWLSARTAQSAPIEGDDL